uniref:Uncharacterized protein n=1 Tax=Romanomermis culicivorax TaxID=13658 RepID=A0A915JI61_ROMCU
MPTDYRWTDVSDENEIDRVSDPRIIHMNGSLRILENHSAEIGTAGFADMVFPLDFDATYTIGSNISCDFFLPTMNKDTMKVHVKNYEVFVSESYLIPIVGSLLPQIVIPGGLIELKENMKIRCGSFTLVYTMEN